MDKLFYFLIMILPLAVFGQKKNSEYLKKETLKLIKRTDEYIVQNKLDSGELLYNAALILYKNELDHKGYCYALLQLNAAKIYQAKNNFISADSLYQISKGILETIDSTKSEYYSLCINNLIDVSMKTRRIPQTEEYLKILVDIKKITYGEQSEEYAKALVKLAIFYNRNNILKDVDTIFYKAIAIYDAKFDRKYPDRISAVSGLAYLFLSRNEYEKAKQLFEEVLHIKGLNEGKNTLDYQITLVNLATIYFQAGDLEKAKVSFLEIKKQLENLNFTNTPVYFGLLVRLGHLYDEIGELNNTELCYIESRDLAAKNYGKSSVEYSIMLNNLGTLYLNLGNNILAEKYLAESIELFNKNFGDKSPNAMFPYSNLGNVYLKLESYQKAKECYKQSLSLQEKYVKVKNELFGNTTLNLYDVCLKLNEDSLAEIYLTNAIIVFEDLVGKDHIFYAKCLLRQAVRAFAKKEKETGFYFLENARRIYQKNNDKRSKEYLACVSIEAAAYLRTGDYAKAEDNFLELGHSTNSIVGNNIMYLSEIEIQDYINLFTSRQEDLLFYCSLNKNSGDEIRKLCYSNSLFYKGFILNVIGQKTRIAKLDSLQVDKLSKISALKRLLSKIYSDPNVDKAEIELRESEISSLEKELYKRINFLIPKLPDAIQVRSSLQPKEVAIEFVRFKPIIDDFELPGYVDSDSTVYIGALILTPKDSAPQFVYICIEDQIKSFFERAGAENVSSNMLYAMNTSTLRSAELLDHVKENGSALYNLIWKPLDSVLNGFKTVYYSPIGMLQKVSFSALPVNSKQTLGSRYELHQMGSTKSLVEKSNSLFSRKFHFDIFGGINYDIIAPTLNDSINCVQQETLNWTYLDGRRLVNEREVFKYLAGSSNEVHSLAALLKSKKINSKVFTGSNATEENLKKLGSDSTLSPDVLHIATHGFYFPYPKKWDTSGTSNYNLFKWNNNPLLRSGIILAGANEAWTSGNCPSNREDGILTAYEISQLNLSNTKLVVLSACETALGDIEGVEGVYGLQRAFKMAGVKYMLLSLWKVPDVESVEFMEVFYKQWLGGKNIHKAFGVAQKKMQDKYRDVNKWGAWVLIE